jgi:hypothetical protein
LIVATCALVFSMAGTGYAVNQINGKTIKKGTIAGKALKKNTLTGTQINESKLGKVPSAGTADSAGSAATASDSAKLAGADAAAYAKTANFVNVSVHLNVGDPDKTLVTNGDISVKAQCYNQGGSDRLRVYATTGTDGALLYTEQGDSQEPLDTSTAPSSSKMTDELSAVGTTLNYDYGYDDTGFVLSADSAHLITLLEGSGTKTVHRGSSTCFYAATFIVQN